MKNQRVCVCVFVCECTPVQKNHCVYIHMNVMHKYAYLKPEPFLYQYYLWPGASFQFCITVQHVLFTKPTEAKATEAEQHSVSGNIALVGTSIQNSSF